MIPYDRYTKLLGQSYHTITKPEKAEVGKYEAAQPKACPKCGAGSWTFLEPYRVVHDFEKCVGKAVGD